MGRGQYFLPSNSIKYKCKSEQWWDCLQFGAPDELKFGAYMNLKFITKFNSCIARKTNVNLDFF